MPREESPPGAIADPVANGAQGGSHAPVGTGKPGSGSPGNSTFCGGNGELILVVDDETCVRLIASQILTRAGFRVITAENGFEGVALHRIHRENLALVISDMIMPVMDGPRMVEALRRDDPGLRIVVASGSNTEADRAKFKVHGVTHFLPKPYTALELIGMVRAVVAAPAERGGVRASSQSGAERAKHAA